MNFAGKNIGVQAFYPDIQTPYSFISEAIVKERGLEFNNLSRSALPGNENNFINDDMNFTRDTILYTVDDDDSGQFSTDEFNGWKIFDVDNTIAPIVGVRIIGSGTTINLQASDISYNENAIFIDFSGLSYRDGLKATLKVTFGIEGSDRDNRLSGTDSNDYLFGRAGDDTISGRSGKDIIDGGLDDDLIQGGSGRDVLVGGSGDDTLNGGADLDRLRGGLGEDRFMFSTIHQIGNQTSACDRISDFRSGDIIDISSIDAIAETSRNDSFEFIGSLNFTEAGQIRVDDRRGFIYGNVDDDVAAEFIISFDARRSLAEADFDL